MKIIERNIGLEVELKENKIPVIVIEDIAIRLSLINSLYAEAMGKEGNWLIVENEKNYELSKKIEMILEPFSLELNNKKVKTKLYQDIKSISQDFFFSQSLELHSHICNYLENIIEKIPYRFNYNDDWNVLEILKAYGIELDDEGDDIYEKLYNYIKIVNQICGTDVFVILNIKQYLNKSQINELYKLTMYSKIHLILIEFNMHGDKFDCEDIYIIDQDGCIITY